MKLTKLQRYTAYCIMLDESVNPSSFVDYTSVQRKSNDCGLCFMASRIFSKDVSDYSNLLRYDLVRELFPEYFIKFNKLILTEEPTWPKRIEMLEKCIEETHPDK